MDHGLSGEGCDPGEKDHPGGGIAERENS